ncbi:hypothetical protein BDD12DRAFT_881775 [Trichophaea hybrida]|nr:hypothetical protein BDD12DRAFT_881775 [Trichophaea hybrida]
MKDFLESSKEYTESFGRAGLTRQEKVLGNWEIVKEWRKLKWQLFHAEDARVLEQQPKSHVSIFQLHMVVISFQSLVRTQRAVNEGVGISRRLEGILSEVCRSTGPKHGIVHLEDALGRHVETPGVLCRDYESFHDVLEIMFRKMAGHERVLRNCYEIEDAEGNLIDTAQWEQKVLPGVRIAMNFWMWLGEAPNTVAMFPRISMACAPGGFLRAIT